MKPKNFPGLMNQVHDRAAPLDTPRAKPAPPKNTRGPSPPDTTLPASITDGLPGGVVKALYPDRGGKR